MNTLHVYILDIVLVALVAIFAAIGAKRGLIKSLVQTFGWLISLIAAYYISEPITAQFYEARTADSVFLSAILRVILFLVVFLLFSVVLRAVGKLVDKVAESLPVVKQLNHLLGGVIGAAEGLLITMALMLVMHLYVIATDNTTLYTLIDKSILFEYFWELFPLS